MRRRIVVDRTEKTVQRGSNGTTLAEKKAASIASIACNPEVDLAPDSRINARDGPRARASAP
jgi:hypothetical protein